MSTLKLKYDWKKGSFNTGKSHWLIIRWYRCYATIERRFPKIEMSLEYQKIIRNGLDETWVNGYINQLLVQKHWKREDRSIGAIIHYTLVKIRDTLMTDKESENLLKKINVRISKMNNDWPLVGISAGSNDTTGQRLKGEIELFDLKELDNRAKESLLAKIGKFCKKQ